MQLTAFTDYALRALMRLAGEPERLFTTEEIAADFGISRHHLTKIVGSLSGAGFVATQRGAGGGFRLARPAEAITLGEIVRLLEARFPLVECFRADGGACVLTPRCRLKARLPPPPPPPLPPLPPPPTAGWDGPPGQGWDRSVSKTSA
jgi:Rrf2 family transcriptional regulator, nitric oxide-sensitive transcriptional repressor